MELILHLYLLPYDADYPVVCLDERPCFLIGQVVQGLEMEAGKPAKENYAYTKNGSACLLAAIEPLTGKRLAHVRRKRGRVEFTRFLKQLAAQYPHAKKIRVVLDNLNTHNFSAFYHCLSAQEAQALVQRFEFYHPPKNASWLNMIEIEFSALARQCLKKRIASINELGKQVFAYFKERNDNQIKINWCFSVKDARKKLNRHYEKVNPHNSIYIKTYFTGYLIYFFINCIVMSMHQNAVAETNFKFPNQTAFYRGKVRDVYTIGDKLVAVASDRISAFDSILPRAIPYKGQVLNQTAAHFLEATSDIVPNWRISSPDPNVTIGYVCEPIKLEMVIRGYLSGHAWREYHAGKRVICGVTMPDGMRESDKFYEPIITPATKADEGHDEDISKENILNKSIVTVSEYAQLEHYTRALFERGTQMAAERGLILVDTKYEFGKRDGQIYLIDEIHTPDSSRYFYADGYEERQARGERQQQLSKEFVREWLMAHGFQGLEDQIMPVMSDDFVETISKRYIELYEKVTGNVFQKESNIDIESRIYDNVIRSIGG